jgi:hypothetical protein
MACVNSPACVQATGQDRRAINVPFAKATSGRLR